MIEAIQARAILDSRGNPTVEVEVLTSGGGFGRAAAPSGASTGKFEAVELRDGGKKFGGLGVSRAVANVNDEIAPALEGADAFDQREIDRLMIGLDGTEDKSRLGANAIIATSLAVAQAAADETGMPLFRYIGGAGAHLLPVPLLNVLNGGAHCDNNVDVQEFMIVPHGAASFSEALQMGSEVYHALKNLLKTRGLSTSVGDEGGFGPDLKSNEQALELLVEAISSAGYEPGAEVALALDVAASQMLTGGSYFLAAEDKTLSAEEMGGLYESWIGRFPIVSIEDPLDEEDWEGWKALTTAIGGKVQLVGDDLFVTNVVRLERGIESETANSILVKVNQIGTVSETGETVSRAIAAGYTAVISHRSGETEDTAIADLAVAWGTGQIKTGAPARSERMAKYNQLLRIEEILAESARYSGSLAFPLAAGTSG